MVTDPYEGNIDVDDKQGLNVAQQSNRSLAVIGKETGPNSKQWTTYPSKGKRQIKTLPLGNCDIQNSTRYHRSQFS